MKQRSFKKHYSFFNAYSPAESWYTLISYFIPEFIISLVVYSLLYLIDARFIAQLSSTTIYATVGTINTLSHFLTKIAEGFCIGTVVMVGTHNGNKDYKQAGKAFINACWLTFCAGLLVACLLYVSAPLLCEWYGFSRKMMIIGVPFLRLKTIGVLCMFIYFALVGFLRGIKRPLHSMYIFMTGAVIFLFFDYGLIFGKWGLPCYGLMGSALAFVIQYIFMLVISVLYLIISTANKKYFSSLDSYWFSPTYIVELWHLSWPVMLDKGVLALGYLWLGYTIAPMGKYAIASYTVIKDLERIAILPAAAFAQVITYVVSNLYCSSEINYIKNSIKRTLFLSSVFVFCILALFCLWPEFFVSLFDMKNKFTSFCAQAFPILSILVFFDLLQLILSAALRGMHSVYLVMYVRLVSCMGCFVPFSFYMMHMHCDNSLLKFIIIYGSFYVGNALMSIIYILYFKKKYRILSAHSAL